MTGISLAVRDLDVVLDANRILSGISLATGSGRFIGIIGPNGSGKSTLIRCISRSLSPEAGTIEVGGRDIALYPRRDLARILGVVPQESQRTFDYTVEDVVGMGRYARQGLLAGFSQEDKTAARAAMVVAGITHLAGRSISNLSGGEWQRVLIARTLAQETSIILLDEPTSHLDISHQIGILSAVHELSRNGRTVIGVFHDLNLAAHFCDEILVIRSGKVAASGTPSRVFTPEILKDVFSLDAEIRTHPVTGKPVIVPLYPERERPSGGKRVHVICGGGTGTPLFSALRNRGCTITCGVLSMNDSDYAAARNLGIPCVAEPPFAEISPFSAEALRGMIRHADLVILTPMPVGSGNLANLLALGESGPVPVILLQSGVPPGWVDCTGGEATAILDNLRADGRIRELPLPDIIRYCSGGET
ncbi:MAG: ABC transporter ATP-binding protein, partial [Methanoregulaceae archaeon]